MSEALLKVGQRVEVTNKDVRGTIAFVGHTSFASGKWIGVVLDEPKGKNNGSLRGQTYFQCEDGHGVFVRASQVTALDDAGNPIVHQKKEGRASSGRLSSASAAARSKPTTVRRKSSPQKQATMSASSSRMSLASSRQSLTGSIVGDEPAASQIPKRASFVETGFVETLGEPQFIPGQRLQSAAGSAVSTAAAAVEDKLTALQYQQEQDNMRAQIRDLNEKLETLKMKRAEDREKLKEFDKAKIQLEQLSEFKAKIMESQTWLQRELQKARQEAREAVEAREAHAEEMADLAETVEMATLDKEMAEEKAETLQLELDAAKERLEELSVELETVRVAGVEDGGGGGSGVPPSVELLQLRQKNARLHETLVRMRDLSAHEKHEQAKLQKELENRRSEIAELGRTKEKLSARVEQLEAQMGDLQEQVDAALGAEEMVVLLAEQKLSLEDRLQRLAEDVAELEAMHDVNEQLAEGSAELEAELREELDLALAAARDARRERDAALETVADRESTICRFRSLVTEMRSSQEEEEEERTEETKGKGNAVVKQGGEEAAAAAAAAASFEKVLADARAQTRAVDLELRRIELEQAAEHVRLLRSFMPEAFSTRGGDGDAVLVLLLLPRALAKADLLLGHARTRVTGTAGARFRFRLHALQAVARQFSRALDACEPDALLRAAAASLPQLASCERVLDSLLALLRQDRLDEHAPTDALDACRSELEAAFATAVPSVEARASDARALLSDTCRAVSAATESEPAPADVVEQLRAVRRRFPPEAAAGRPARDLGLPSDTYERLRSLRDGCCGGGGGGGGTTTTEDTANRLAQLAELLRDAEFDVSVAAARPARKAEPPVAARAAAVRAELDAARALSAKLDAKDADIRELKRALRAKQDELSEMLVRKELAEKKLGNVSKDYELTAEKLNRKLDEARQQFQRKEREFEETLDHLQSDIDSLELERGEMRDKLKSYSKSGGGGGGGGSGSRVNVPRVEPTTARSSALVRDSPMLLDEIRGLRDSLAEERARSAARRSNDLADRLSRLRPLPLPLPLPSSAQCRPQDSRLSRLAAEAETLRRDALSVLASPHAVDLSRPLPLLLAPLVQEKTRAADVAERASKLRAAVADEVVRRRPGAKAVADFAVFPTPQVARALRNPEPVLVGKVSVSVPPTTAARAFVDLLVTKNDLRDLLLRFV